MENNTEIHSALITIQSLPPRVILALARLGELLPADVVTRLPELIEEVETRFDGFGDVGIRISKRHVLAPWFKFDLPKEDSQS